MYRTFLILALVLALPAHAEHEETASAIERPVAEIAPAPAKVQSWPAYRNCLTGNAGGFSKSFRGAYKEARVVGGPEGRMSVELADVTENPGYPPQRLPDYEYGKVRAELGAPTLQEPGLTLWDQELPVAKKGYQPYADRITVARLAGGRTIVSLHRETDNQYFGRPLIPGQKKVSVFTTFDSQGSFASFLMLEDGASPPNRYSVPKEICSPRDDGQALGVSASLRLQSLDGLNELTGVKFPASTGATSPEYPPSRGADPKAYADYIARLKSELAQAEKRKIAIETGEYKKDPLFRFRYFLMSGGKLP